MLAGGGEMFRWVLLIVLEIEGLDVRLVVTALLTLSLTEPKG